MYIEQLKEKLEQADTDLDEMAFKACLAEARAFLRGYSDREISHSELADRLESIGFEVVSGHAGRSKIFLAGIFLAEIHGGLQADLLF